MKRVITLFIVTALACTAAKAQMNIGSNTAPDSSAMLQISGTTKGFLPPRLSRTEMNAITKPVKGLVVFNTTDSALFMRRDSGWVKLMNDGSVTSTSIITANGLAGMVANPGTTPAITLRTTVNGMVKGNGTAFSSATSGTDYAPGTAANATGIVKSATGTGALTTAVAADFPVLNQNTTGTASNITGLLNATSLPALTGDVTSTAGSSITTIAAGVVINNKLATMPTQTFKGRTTAGTGSPEDLTPTQATAMLNTFGTAKGLVPGVTSNTTQFLRADGTFAVPTGTNAGTVTQVSVTSANGISGTVANTTTTPAITLSLGAITPSSVAATGTVTGSNLSGTNTGDETNATIKTKLGTASATTDGYLTQADWIAFNSKPGLANVWSTTGNAGTSYATNFIGTTDNKSFRLRTNNTQRLIIDSLGNVGIGTAPDFTASPNAEKFLVDAGTTSSNNLIGAQGSYNSYLQFNISNNSSGSSASSDVVATADNGSETSGFIDMGINSSTFATGGAIGGANTAYLYSTGNDLAIGNGTANKSVIFFTGGLSETNYTERFRLDASGRVGIGTKMPTADLSIAQSSGVGSSRGITITGNSIGGTSSGTGFLMTLGYNAANNKQLWLGDPEYANNSAGTFVRYIAASGYGYFDAINGTNDVRRSVAIGYAGDQTNSGVILGSDENSVHPGSFIWANGNMTIGNGYRANAAPANGLLVQGNVAIGTTTTSTSTLALGGSMSYPVKLVTVNYTLTASDYTVINNNLSLSLTWTLPSPSSCAGRVYNLVNHGALLVTLAGGSVVTGISSTITAIAAGASLQIISDGTNWQKMN